MVWGEWKTLFSPKSCLVYYVLHAERTLFYIYVPTHITLRRRMFYYTSDNIFRYNFFPYILYTPQPWKKKISTEILIRVFIYTNPAFAGNKRYNYKLLTFVTLAEYELKVFKSSSELNNITIHAQLLKF